MVAENTQNNEEQIKEKGNLSKIKQVVQALIQKEERDNTPEKKLQESVMPEPP